MRGDANARAVGVGGRSWSVHFRREAELVSAWLWLLLVGLIALAGLVTFVTRRHRLRRGGVIATTGTRAAVRRLRKGTSS